ncbi:MAG: hypothetical protein C0607_03505 [Azoarcus sp.]|nr:MAG: hypothetical protein C0607_03505 [Azoarcus sp.]TVT55701.1 MAG: hypothetical protein FHK80_13880 [Azoarcus sp. PHD]
MNQIATPIQATREKIEQGLLAKFGEAFEKAAEQAKAITDPALRALGAARIALEHAVLQTAIEKDMPTKSVAAMLEKASPQQVAHFIREGKKSIQRNYGVQADAMVAALSAQVANVDLPRGMAQTETMRQLVEQGRGLVHQTVMEMYQVRGQFTHTTGPRSEILSLHTPAGAVTARDQLQNHMVFIESAIDYAVRSGGMDAQQGQMLKERVEHQVFNTPAETNLSEQFKGFYDRTGQSLRREVMTDARKVTTDKTVAEIAERLHEARDRVQRLRAGAER